MPSQSPSWTLHQLEVAYQQGYLEALLKRAPRRPAHEVLAASWEAGWRDGAVRLRQWQDRLPATTAAPRKVPRLSARIRRTDPDERS